MNRQSATPDYTVFPFRFFSRVLRVFRGQDSSNPPHLQTVNGKRKQLGENHRVV